MSLHKFLFIIGAKRRNPSLFPYLDFLKESDKWTIEKLKSYQFQKCKEFLIFVSNYSPFYKTLFQEAQFDATKINDLDDLKRIPIMDKNTLLKFSDEIHTTFAFKRKIHAETSGTSGQPLKFLKNEEWDSHNRAAMYRGYSWYEVDPWDKNGYFWGYNINRSAVAKTKFLDFLQNRFRVFSYDENEILKFAHKLTQATYLHGYSSMIYEVAKIVNQLRLENKYKLKMIKGTSEKIYDNYHTEVQKAFGLKVVSEYGAAEAGLIAYECPDGSMHINVENVVVEVEDGEILVTNLLSKSFPIIRYKLGDSVTLAEPNFRCACGRSHPVLVDVLGRVGKKIVGHKKKYPSLTFYYVFKNLALSRNIILNYQAIQTEKGRVELKIEQSEVKHLKILQDELTKYFLDDVEFNISFGQKLHSRNGKLKDFITEIE